jgi:nifR3 family TIM-barrel protein
MNVWRELPKPFLVLAPLANVTDPAFRRLIAKYSKTEGGIPYVTYTEFVSADGLMLANDAGKAKLMRDLLFTDAERPLIAQFFTARPEMMEKAAALALKMGFDGVDINMGCPDKSIEGQGAGAKLIQNPKLAQEVLLAAKRGACSEFEDGIPVSVKTRLGYNKDVLEEWLPALLEVKPAVVTLHARTRKEMSKVPAKWDRVKRAVEIRDAVGSDTLIVGNGDVLDTEDAKMKAEESGADGVMLGRAIFGRPWLFAPDFPPALSERLRIAVEHAQLFEELLGDIKSFAIMKKHFKAYAEGFPGAKELRMELMETNTAAEVRQVIEAFILNQ